MPVRPAPANATRPIETVAEAEKLIGHLGSIMDTLVKLVEQETELVRAGRLGDAARLEASKAELAQAYVANATQVKANSAALSRQVPKLLEELRRRHDEFQALLQINLAVLATAHAVSEGIIRGVAGELARKAAPRTYGNSGRANEPRTSTVIPVALSRTL